MLKFLKRRKLERQRVALEKAACVVALYWRDRKAVDPAALDALLLTAEKFVKLKQ